MNHVRGEGIARIVVRIDGRWVVREFAPSGIVELRRLGPFGTKRAARKALAAMAPPPLFTVGFCPSAPSLSGSGAES